MKIAIVGAGISGLTCAYYLARDHQITVFESEAEIGGHTATKKVEVAGETFDIDTGFIVYNDWTYPNFIKLMNDIGVLVRASEMSFSVTCEASGLEYAGSNINTLFADRKNLLRPAYWKMLRDIVSFNKKAIKDLQAGNIPAELSLGEYLNDKGYGTLFRDKYLVPMGAAIWSSTIDAMEDFPALFFIRFFKNHGLLSVKNRPQWYTIEGGSRNYLPALTESFSDSILTNTSISKIQRTNEYVDIEYTNRGNSSAAEVIDKERFDAIVFATHSDQALALLDDATANEKNILGAIPYRSNEVVLHTDASRLPWRERAWSSWNYRLSKGHSTDESSLAKLTYSMNILQGIESDTVFCVSLNQTDEIDQSKILGVYNYSHPVFTAEGVVAQARRNEISGVNNTWFCGAYWANGFHEDGVSSALDVVGSVRAATENLRSVDVVASSDTYENMTGETASSSVVS